MDKGLFNRLQGELEASEKWPGLNMSDLLDKGFAREIEMRGVKQYRVRLAPKRGRELPANLWQALDDKVQDEEAQP